MDNQIDQSPPVAYNPDYEAKPMMTLPTLPPAELYPLAPFPAIRPGEGVSNEVKPAQFKLGGVSIWLTGADRWLVRYHDPASGRDVRRRLTGLTEKEILNVASNIKVELLTKDGYLPEKAKPAPTIADALAEAIELANTQKTTRKERARLGAKFVSWLAGRFPTVKTWDQLKPAMLQAYVNELERSGKRFDTIRLNVAPVKLAWRYVAENYPELVKPLARIKITSPPPTKGIQCLDAGGLARLLDWLKVHKPELWPMACLQGLAGLRMLEAAALRRQDVDLKTGTVTVTKTDHHTPKTKTSYRTIPISGEVLEALRVAVAGQKVRPTTGEIFTNEDGELWTQSALGHRWTYTLRRAAKDLFKVDPKAGKMTDDQAAALAQAKARFLAIPARKLRAAFATLAGRLGAQDRILKSYIGHSSGDILGGHYRRIGMDELRSVSTLMEGWRHAKNEADSGNFLATADESAL